MSEQPNQELAIGVSIHPTLSLTLKANAVNLEDNFKEIRLFDEETGSLAVIRGDLNEFEFKRGASYQITITEITYPVTVTPPTPAQQDVPTNSESQSNNSKKSNKGIVKAGAESSGEKK